MKASIPPGSSEWHLLGVAQIAVRLVLNYAGFTVNEGFKEAANRIGRQRLSCESS